MATKVTMQEYPVVIVSVVVCFKVIRGGKMLYISVDDFFDKALSKIDRQEELYCARRMALGDSDSRQRLIEGYLPVVAFHVKHAPKQVQSLGLILTCHQALEKAVDSFNFLQESETFSHRLSWCLRQATVKYIAMSRME